MNLKPLWGIPVGLVIAVLLGQLPEPWGFAAALAFCCFTIGMCLYFLWDLRRGQRRMQVLLRRTRYLLEQDREL